MKKPLRLSLTALTVLLLLSGIFQLSETPFRKPKKLAKTDRIDLAMEQEFMRTKDPALNRIPREEMIKAIEFRDAKLNSGLNTAVSGVSWTERGPNNIGGRTRALWFDLNAGPSYTKVWAAGVAGGLWFTNDITAASPTWNKVDDFFDNMAVTTFAQSASSPQTMYFGTGEGWFNVDYVQGMGIWKSTNGGTTWAQLASTNNSSFYFVQKIVVDASGNIYACTRSAGLQKSADGGVSWTKVLGSGVNGGVNDNAADVEVAPNGDIYCSLGIFSTGGIYRSTDGGTSWTSIMPGGVTARRIELATCPSTSDTVYAIFQSATTLDCNNIRRYKVSTNTWTTGTVPTIVDQGLNSNFTRGQAWYDLIAAVDPNNSASLYIGGVDALRSDDGGASWTQMTTWSLFSAPAFNGNQLVHADHHAIVYAPGSSSRALWGTDGGIYYTANANIAAASKPTYVSKNTGYNVTQYYSGALHPSTTNYFLGGAQDNGSHKFTGAGVNSVSTVSGGDGGFTHIDQDNPLIQITSYVFNNYYVSTNGGTSFTSFSKNDRGGFINASDYDNTNNIIYAGDDAGTYYRWLNPASNGADAQVTVTNFGTATVKHVAVSPVTNDRVYFGLSDGSVVMVDNASSGTAKTGTVIKPAAPGEVSCVAVDPANENHMLVTHSNFGVTNIYESTNALQASPTWTATDGNLPNMPVFWAIFDPRNSDWALLATDLGVWSTDNLNGASTDWDPTNSGLANVRVDMLDYRSSDRTVLAATHGRGMFTATIPSVLTPDVNFAAATTSQAETNAASSSCRNYKDYTVAMTIANAPVGNATITVSVQAGATATQGLDYDFTTNGNFTTPSNTFVFANGATTPGTITLRIYDDAEVESSESFTLTYAISGTTNAQAGIGAQTHVVTITDNDSNPIASSTSNYQIGTYNYNLGSASNGTGTGEPFNAKLASKRSQFLYKASELTAAGMSAGTINSLQLYFAFKNSTRPYTNVQIKMGTTGVSYLIDASVTVAGTSTYKSIASFTPVSGWNTFTLDNPFTWDGTSNVVVEVCYDNGSAAAGNFADILAGYSDGGTGTQGNMFYQDNINCTGSFSTVGYFINGIKPMAVFGMSVAGTTVASTLNTSRSEYLGPNSDVYFYSAGGELLARVQNLTSHDYGCTQVVIDRAGTGTTAFWNNNTSNYLMNKTFRIIPTTNNPSGSYNVTLYFTAAEVNGWQTATGQSFNSIQLVKVAGQILSVTPATPGAAGTVSVVTPTRGTLGTNYTLTYNFTTGFSGFGAGVAGASLPVRLLDFTGKIQANSAVLDWATSFEQNSKEFIIERSYDGLNFSFAGRIAAAGNSTTTRRYTFTDKAIAQEANYYRLKQVDLDGKADYSKVILLRNPSSGKYPFRILTNPVQQTLDVQFGDLPRGKVQISLYDLSGKQLVNWNSENLTQSRVRIDLSPYHLANAVYLVKARTATETFTEKVIKR